jgi:hypothetical protein
LIERRSPDCCPPPCVGRRDATDYKDLDLLPGGYRRSRQAACSPIWSGLGRSSAPRTWGATWTCRHRRHPCAQIRRHHLRLGGTSQTTPLPLLSLAAERAARRLSSVSCTRRLPAALPVPTPLACSSFLYAGPVWDATRHYLRAGGWPLINSSHGDASIAVLEPSLTVVAAAPYRSDRYRVTTKRLHDCLLAMVWAGTGALDVTCELLADGQWQSSGDPRLAVPPAERLPLRRARVARGGQLRDVRP